MFEINRLRKNERLSYRQKVIRYLIYKLRARVIFLFLKINSKLFNLYVKKEFNKRVCFFVPTTIICSKFKKDLTIYINPEYLNLNLKDWLKVDGKSIINISYYFFGDGNWENISSDISKSIVYKELLDLKNVNMDYKSSKHYLSYVQKMNKNNPTTKQHKILNTYKSIDSYFERFINLYNSIKEKGVLKADNFKKEKENKAIGIAVNSNGEILKLPGAQHRVVISKILNLEKIPVEIRLIHKEYIEKIMNLYNLNYDGAILKIVYLMQEKYQVEKSDKR